MQPCGWAPSARPSPLPTGDRRSVDVKAQPPSVNVQNLQRRAAGVLPVHIDVPRAGKSHVFVRPLVVDEETSLTFRYRVERPRRR